MIIFLFILVLIPIVIAFGYLGIIMWDLFKIYVLNSYVREPISIDALEIIADTCKIMNNHTSPIMVLLQMQEKRRLLLLNS